MWVPPAHSPYGGGQAFAAVRAGPGEVARLEDELASTFRAESVLATASGTHALQLAMRFAIDSLGGGGVAVALPAYSCFDLVTAALAAPARVAFYDVDPHSLVPDADSLERAVRRGARVVVAANLFAFPLDWSVLRALRDEFGALLIEDAAQGLGSTWEGRSAGDLGDYTVLSFARGKGWTGGGGGALLARGGQTLPDVPLEDPTGGSVGRMARALAQWALSRPALYGIPARAPFLGLGETHFREPSPAAGMHPYSASLVRASRSLARIEVARRRDTAARLRLALQGVSTLVFPTAVPGSSPGWLRLPARIDGGVRELPIELRRLGVYRGYPRVLPDLPAAVRLERVDTVPGVPGARRLAQELITLPTHSRTPVDRLVDELPRAFRAHSRL